MQKSVHQVGCTIFLWWEPILFLPKFCQKNNKMAGRAGPPECFNHSDCLKGDGEMTGVVVPQIAGSHDLSESNTSRKKRIKRRFLFRDKGGLLASPFQRRLHYSSSNTVFLLIALVYLSTLILSVSASILGSLDYESKIIPLSRFYVFCFDFCIQSSFWTLNEEEILDIPNKNGLILKCNN